MFNAPMVVGYKGEIGRFILAGLLEHLPKANDILCTDVNNSDEDVIQRLEKADYVFLCVPLQYTEEWLLHFKPHLIGKQIVEQSSIKSFLFVIPALRELSFVSMHLLFRPSATPVPDRRGVVFCDAWEPARLDRFARELGKALATPMSTLEAKGEPSHIVHDKLMARQQALVHRTILALSESLVDLQMRTYVGNRVCELADRVREGDQQLYRMIQENPYLSEELKALRNRLA